MKKTIKELFLTGNTNNIFPFNFPDFNITPVIKKYQNFPQYKRKILQQVLKKQNENLPYYNTSKKYIELITEPNTFFITTGQQAGLYGGPLYTLYKAATTIFWTNKLNKQFPEYNFVPLFWIASNDHDYKEINHVFINPYIKITYTGNFKNLPVGTHKISEKINEIKQLYEIQKYWKVNTIWWEAFAKTLASLLGKYGILFLNPLDINLKKLAEKLFLNVIKNKTFYYEVKKQSQWLEKNNYKLQIKPREIPLFIITEKGRLRYNSQNNGITDISLLDPDVALRPLFQQTILPNVIYIAGWNELQYWTQLIPAFNSLNIPLPIVIPRNSYIIIPKKFQNITKYNITTKEIIKPIPYLREKFASNFINPETFETIKHNIEKLIIKHLTEYNNIPNNNEIQKNLIKKLNFQVERKKKLYYKHITKWKQKDWKKLLKLRNELIPEKQERIWSILSLYYYQINIDKLIEQITTEYCYNTKVLIL